MLTGHPRYSDGVTGRLFGKVTNLLADGNVRMFTLCVAPHGADRLIGFLTPLTLVNG